MKYPLKIIVAILLFTSRLHGGEEHASGAESVHDRTAAANFAVHQIATPGGKNFGQTSAVDVDKDGDLDFISGTQKGRLYWFEFESADKWKQHSIGEGAKTDVAGIAFDVDRDGWIDQVSGGTWFRNPGNPRGVNEWPRYETGAIKAHDHRIGDVNGDGRVELFSILDRAGVYWYEIPDDPTRPWIEHRIVGVTAPQCHGGIALGDIDGDGDLDVARVDRWLENADGKGLDWKEHLDFDFGKVGPWGIQTRAELMDVDRDGDLDLIQAEGDVLDGRVAIFINEDKGRRWTMRLLKKEGHHQDFHSMSVADFDNDGDLDIFTGGGPLTEGIHKWFLFEQRANGNWTEHLIQEGHRTHESVAADIDGDGDIDILTKPWGGNVHLFVENKLVEPSPTADAVNRVQDAPQWREVELSFTSKNTYSNHYTDVKAWVEFTHEDGTQLSRPMFWDGGNTFRARFASSRREGRWNWVSFDRNEDAGLRGHTGTLQATVAPDDHATIFQRHGFWHIPSGGRNLIHADGTARLLCADTAWALPWRATADEVRVYAADRQEKGFNAALLMTVQPDLNSTGPRSRTEGMGFDVGFDDLPEGTLHQLRPEYFQTFDSLVGILVEHGIAPVYQPVFHGYGWKGGGTAGNVVSADDYARYCRYLVARYGARPAIWLIGGDGPATSEAILQQLDRAGNEIEKWDAYQQPTGIHYAPHSLNRSHQDKEWLDFQWCQTGHQGEHVPQRVADMWRNEPVKAVANGEPSYENMGRVDRASGWWQGHEAWCNLTAGGTMGVVYGAGSLWQWRHHPNEPGFGEWTLAADAGWKEALAFEGSKYPGIAAKIFDGLPLAGMQPNWTCTYGRQGLLVPNKLFVLYLPDGGGTAILSDEVPSSYRVYDPKTGEVVRTAELSDKLPAQVNSGSSTEPRVIVFAAEGAE